MHVSGAGVLACCDGTSNGTFQGLSTGEGDPHVYPALHKLTPQGY